jgi:hypothetical protein
MWRRRRLRLALVAAILLGAVVWTADYLILWRRAAFGQVDVHYRYAIHMKNQRIEQSSEKTATEECVSSLFPHYDETPCWYLRRHTEQLLNVDGSPWHFWYGQ